MNTGKEHTYLKSKRIRPWMYIIVLFFNVAVFAAIGTVYNQYSLSNSQKLYEENIKSVESLNAASANAAFTYTKSMGIKIDDTVSYIRVNDLDHEEAVEFLEKTNTDPDRQFQLILSGSYGATGELSFGDYSGVSLRTVKHEDGSLKTVKTDIIYGGGYYDILRSFTDVNDKNLNNMCFAPEFTDPDTKQKCFGVYRHVVLTDAAGQKKLYTLLLAINSQTALNAYNMQNDYAGQSTVLIDESGDYIIKNSDYRNANFYDYIANYNNLTREQKTAIINSVHTATATGEGSTNLFYNNHRGDGCIFSVTVMENGWYSVTCVPTSSFALKDNSVNYSLVILLLFAALFIADGTAIYFVGRVLSYNVKVAKAAQEAANQASKAKSRFLSTMSHELRTPLNAIIGLTALSQDNVSDPAVLKDYLKKIDISSKLLLQLISDILDISAIESDKLKLNNGDFDLTKVIASLSAIYYDQCASKGIEFNVILKNIHSELLSGDFVRVNQVLLNFLSNAVKFTPGGGNVTLKAEQLSEEDGRVLIRFEVIDTGCGISDELQNRLFLPFERAHGDAAREHSGTGLGLSISKSLAELMGGRVGVESTEGEGSFFWVELPFTVANNPSHRVFSPIKELHVLAAIGNLDERIYIGRILEGFCIRHSLTDCAQSALKLLRSERDSGTPFDLCMLDWKLPDLNALDAATHIRREFDADSLTVVILAYNLADVQTKCYTAGADLVFGKPVFPSALYNFLEELTTGQTRIIPDTAQSYDLSGKHILLVEDNTMNLMIAQLLLKKIGLTVEAAENGKLGFERFMKSAPGYFDAILMDVQMPVMNGYEATAAIRGCSHPQAKSIPILAMTADAFSEDVEKAKKAGMNRHLSKPIMPDSLYSALKEFLH